MGVRPSELVMLERSYAEFWADRLEDMGRCVLTLSTEEFMCATIHKQLPGKELLVDGIRVNPLEAGEEPPPKRARVSDDDSDDDYETMFGNLFDSPEP